MRFIRIVITSLIISCSSVPAIYAQWVSTTLPAQGAVTCMASVGGRVYAGFQSGFYMTTNKGETWILVNNGLPGPNSNPNNYSGIFVYNDNLLFACAGGQVFRSSNYGSNWYYFSNGLQLASYKKFVSIGNTIITGAQPGLFISSNSGFNWGYFSPTLPDIDLKAIALNAQHLFIGRNLNIYHSTNMGTTWTSPMGGLPQFSSPRDFILSGSTLVGAIGEEIWTLPVNDTTWISTSYSGGEVKCFTAFGDRIYAGSANQGVFLSDDNGSTWSPVSTGLPTTAINAFAFDGITLFAGTSTSGIWMCSDLVPVELISFSSSVQKNNILLEWTTATEKNSARYEVERKTSKVDWTKIAEIKAAGSSTNLISYAYTDKQLLPGNYSYRLKMVDYDGSYKYSKVIESGIQAIEDYKINQNYPNPFNPSTKISYSIPVQGPITIKLYNVLGDEVAELVNEIKPAGNYEVSFSAGSLSSGIYYYRMQSGTFTETKKLCILK